MLLGIGEGGGLYAPSRSHRAFAGATLRACEQWQGFNDSGKFFRTAQ
jgi:hypothetical protein